jgi:hypothetical protein
MDVFEAYSAEAVIYASYKYWIENQGITDIRQGDMLLPHAV